MPEFEDDSKRQLQHTDPGGNATEININRSPSVCLQCGSHCYFEGKSSPCEGMVNATTHSNQNNELLSDIHMCEKHREEHGSTNRWYDSKPSNKELVGRMLGSTAELFNWILDKMKGNR